MLPVRFDDISSADILRLVENKTAERKTLEYKEKLTIGTGDERAEFLADISSFANASGGDIIFGISDERDAGNNATGTPSEIKPLSIESVPTEIGKIEQIIQNGVQPRLPVVQVKAVEIPGTGIIIVVRVIKSWVAPHMVTQSNRSRFYSRNSSTGKFQLDVQQIGDAFRLQRGLGERLRAWKADRIGKAIAGDGPVPSEGPQILLHFVSASALTDGEQSHPRVFEPYLWGKAYRLLSGTPEGSRYNADGFLTTSIRATDKRQSYLQIFRDGSLEYGDNWILNSFDAAKVPSKVMEEHLAQTFGAALTLLKHLEVPEPVFVAVTLLNVKGLKMALPQRHTWLNWESLPFDRDVDTM